MHIAATNIMCASCGTELQPAMVRCRQCGMLHRSNVRGPASFRTQEPDIFSEILEQAQKLGLPFAAPVLRREGTFADILLKAPDFSDSQPHGGPVTESQADAHFYRPALTHRPRSIVPEKVISQRGVAPRKVRKTQPAIKIERVQQTRPAIQPEKVIEPQQLSSAQQELIDELDAFEADL